MSEQLNRWCKRKKSRAIIYLLPQMIFLIWLIGIKHIYYATCDDTVIHAMVSGGYGEPTQYLCVVSPIFGYIMKSLFQVFPIANWLGITYMILMILGFLLIDLIFIEQETEFIRTVILSFILLIGTFFVWTYFTFTVVSYVCAMGGLFWCMAIIKKEQRITTWKALPGWILISFGILIRTTAIYSLIIVIGFWALYEMLSNKKWRLLFLCILILGEVKVVGVVNGVLNEQSEIQSDYIAWNSARSFLGDYLTQEEMVGTGFFSETDAEAFFNAFLWDKELFSMENMKQAAVGEKQNLRMDNVKHIYMEFENMFHDVTAWDDYQCFYFIWFWAICIFEFLRQRETRKQIVAIASGALATSFLFFILGRMVYRVLMPGYVFAVICILAMSLEYSKSEKRTEVAYMAVMGVITAFMLRAYGNYQLVYDQLYMVSNERVLAYLEENSDKLYLPCDSNAYSIEMAKDVLQYDGKEYISNLIGNWNIYSESYYELMSAYDIKNPDCLVLDIADSDTIRLVMLNGEIPDYVIDFIEERTGQKVETHLEKKITDTGYGDWYFYSVIVR